MILVYVQGLAVVKDVEQACIASFHGQVYDIGEHVQSPTNVRVNEIPSDLGKAERIQHAACGRGLLSLHYTLKYAPFEIFSTCQLLPGLTTMP